MMKKIIFMLALGMFSGLMAQGSIYGTVTDQDGNSLPGECTMKRLMCQMWGNAFWE